MISYKDKIVIITGAASGIGRGLAEAFAQKQATVILCDINENGVQQVTQNIQAKGGDATAYQHDVCNQIRTTEIWEEVTAKYGRIDYVFNNAGYGMAEEVQDIPYDQWQKMIDVNLMGVVYGAMEAFKIMKEKGGGYIVNVASLAGLIGSPGSTPYATTKTAVIGFSKSLRVEGAAFGIKVSAICPGFIDTGIYDAAWTGKISNALFKKTIPLPIISLDEAVESIFKGLEKEEQLIIFPKYARSLNWIARLLPARLEKKQIFGMVRFRKLKEKR